MAAVITIGSLSLDATGKVLTGTLSGGTGTGYALTNANGLFLSTPVVSTVPTSASIVGTTLTLNQSAAFFSIESVRLTVNALNTIVDDGGNTGANATNTVVTNNSTVSGSTTNIISNTSLFDFDGAATVVGTNGVTGLNSLMGSSYGMTFVVNVTVAGTDVVLVQNLNSNASGITKFRVDAGAEQTYQGHNIGFETVTLATNLGVGKHIVRTTLPSNYYTRDVRLSGGTATIVTVPCPVAIFKDNVAGFTLASQTSPAKRWGTLKYSGNTVNNPHPGFQFNVAMNATGLDMIAYTGVGVGVSFCVATDTAAPAPISSYSLVGLADPGATYRNANLMQPVVAGLSPGSHTVELLDLGVGLFVAIRAYNGTKLASAASAGANTISVSDVTYLAAGDWLILDYLGSEEVVQIAPGGISGSGPYTITLTSNLVNAHASGTSVRNFTPSAAPTLSAGTQPTFSGRLVVVSDSIWHAEAISTAGTFPASGYVSYDIRASNAFMAARAANFELIHGATQGWKSSQSITDNAANTYDPTPPATHYLIAIGRNDYGAGATPLATYETNIETLIGQAKTAAPAGAKIMVNKLVVSTSAANGVGATPADYNTQQATAVTNTQAATYTIIQIDQSRSLTKTAGSSDMPSDGVHPSISGTTIAGTGGQNKMANELVPHLAGYTFALSAASGAAGSPVTLTVTLGGGATFVSADTLSVAVSGAASGMVTITPTAGQTSASATYTPASAGSYTFTPSNGQGWTNAAATSYVAASAGAPAALFLLGVG